MAFSGSGSGTALDPYQITSWAELDQIRDDRTAAYKLMNDLDSSSPGWAGIASSANTWGTGRTGWQVIGLDSAGNYEGAFTGSIDGDYHVISDLYSKNTQVVDNMGFMAVVAGSATIKNLGFENIYIYGSRGHIGGIIAYVAGTGDLVDNCYITGEVVCNRSGGNAQTGGIAGRISGGITIRDCWNGATITRSSSAAGFGGIVGSIYNAGFVMENCHSYGAVPSVGSDVGGMAGNATTGFTDTDNYWDTDTSGTSSSAAGTGKTTAQMKTPATFSTWDIAAVDTYDATKTWGIGDLDAVEINSGYPYLMGFENEPISSTPYRSQYRPVRL